MRWPDLLYVPLERWSAAEARARSRKSFCRNGLAKGWRSAPVKNFRGVTAALPRRCPQKGACLPGGVLDSGQCCATSCPRLSTYVHRYSHAVRLSSHLDTRAVTVYSLSEWQIEDVSGRNGASGDRDVRLAEGSGTSTLARWVPDGGRASRAGAVLYVERPGVLPIGGTSRPEVGTNACGTPVRLVARIDVATVRLARSETDRTDPDVAEVTRNDKR